MADAENKVAFELVSPEKLLISRQVDMVVVPGEEGDFGVLPGHASVIAGLRDWVLEIHDGGEVSDRLFLSRGFAEVTPERCTVLAEEALLLSDIDSAGAEASVTRAERALEDAGDNEARAEAETKLTRAQALVEALSYFKTGA
jgi:F-type H+-transporting ATPase subunit epsilon